MRPMRDRKSAAAVRPVRPVGTTLSISLVLALALGMLRLAPSAAVWVDSGVRATSVFRASPDWVPPLVGGSVVAKASGYLTGSVRPGGTYYVYASVTESGNPPSGIASERADVSAITPGGSTTVLVAGTYSAGGVVYTHRSALLTATSPLAEGARPYSIASTDLAGNSRVQTGYSAIVDSTAPAPSDIQAANALGGVAGRADQGDTVTFTFTEAIDPESILAGWQGTATDVVVRLIDGGCLLVILSTACSADRLAVYDAANVNQLPLGSVDLQDGSYHGTALGTASPSTFGASGTRSRMVQSGTSITVTLGTASAVPGSTGLAHAMVWTPSASAVDAAGNPALTAAVTEKGALDLDF